MSVPAGIVQDLGAADMPLEAGDVLLDIVLVDVPNSFLDTLVPFADSTVPFDIVHPFSFDNPPQVPMPEALVKVTWEWIQDPGSAPGDLLFSGGGRNRSRNSFSSAKIRAWSKTNCASARLFFLVVPEEKPPLLQRGPLWPSCNRPWNR